MAAHRAQQLVKMASQIALNLGGGDDAAARTAQHIRRFWTPAMRGQLIEYWRNGGNLDAVVVASLEALEKNGRSGSETG